MNRHCISSRLSGLSIFLLPATQWLQTSIAFIRNHNYKSSNFDPRINELYSSFYCNLYSLYFICQDFFIHFLLFFKKHNKNFIY